MSKYDVSIIGEPFLKYVKDQVNVRQSIQASGLSKKSRTDQEIQYLNGRNSWVKVASSVSIEDITRLTKLGFTENQATGLMNTGLAKEFVLFNGSSNVKNPLQRFGTSTSSNILSGNNYGTLGADEFGLQAMPGIQGFSVGHNNLGSIRTGELTIRANSLRQFSVLELLYVRLGYTILVEWGNGIFYNNQNEFSRMGQTLIDDTKNGWFAQKETTHLQFYEQINKMKKQYDGNYDAFFCKVNNFDWSFNPDGYYDIKLSLVSLGDVVESLRIDNLTDQNRISNTSVENQEINKSNLANFIYCNLSQKSISENYEVRGKDFAYVSKNSLQDQINAQRASGGTGGSAAAIVPKNTAAYVRLGAFLEWLENNSLPFYVAGEETEPMLCMNTIQQNFFRNFPGMFSMDPNICVIRNKFVRDGNQNEIGATKSTKKSFDQFYTVSEIIEPPVKEGPQTEQEAAQDSLLTGDFGNSPGARSTATEVPDSVGVIMNIYLNLDYLKTAVDNSRSNLKNNKLFPFIKMICDDINSCFGGYVNLEPNIQDEKILNIIDVGLPVRTDREGGILPKEDKSPTIKMFGYDQNNNTSNFVRDFSFNTKISKELASMIAIGATANNQSNLEVSDFFNNLNKGLKDRFAQKVIDGDREQNKKEIDKLECASETKNQSKSFGYKVIFVSGFVPIVVPDTIKDLSREDDSEYEPTLEGYRAEYIDYISTLFGTSENEFGGNPGEYFSGNSSTVSKGKSILEKFIKKYIQVVYYQTKDEASLQSSILGFIPIDLNIKIEGLGGLRIYNQLIVDTAFLPEDYRDSEENKKVEFVVKGVTHEVINNEWTTTISAVSKPSSDLAFNVSLETDNTSVEREDLTTEEIDDSILFFPPLGTLFPVIRNDAGGSGTFGASRDEGERVHTGVDYRTRDNQAIFAPITGTIQASKATSSSKLPGFKIIGSGEFSGITAFVFYAKPTVRLGSTVTKGDEVARSVNLQRSRGGDYSEDVTNHIHFKIEKGSSVVDPTDVKYTI